MRESFDQVFQSSMGSEGLKPRTSSEVSTEIGRRRVIVQLDLALNALRAMREDQRFWLGLGPAFRGRYEDFQGDLAMLRAAYRE